MPYIDVQMGLFWLYITYPLKAVTLTMYYIILIAASPMMYNKCITLAKYFIVATEFVLKYFNSMVVNIIYLHTPIIL